MILCHVNTGSQFFTFAIIAGSWYFPLKDDNRLNYCKSDIENIQPLYGPGTYNILWSSKFLLNLLLLLSIFQ